MDLPSVYHKYWPLSNLGLTVQGEGFSPVQDGLLYYANLGVQAHARFVPRVS